MEFAHNNWRGILLCFALAVPAYALGLLVTIVGGPIFGIAIGVIVALFLRDRTRLNSGIGFTSKYVLQTAVVLLGFGLNLGVIAQTGWESLPIIVTTICTALVVAFVVSKALGIPGKIATLIGVGSSICGGSAIAATAPVIKANDEEVAQSISIIFLFNVIAAIVFPYLGNLIGFSTVDGGPFGIFAGTAVNDTSSVTATAATWDGMHGLGTATLDKAVTVKLTRTLAIIPITLILAAWIAWRAKKNATDHTASKITVRQVFPMFILWFVVASLITTVVSALGAPEAAFAPLKELSKFLIVMAMVAIGLNTDIVKLVKSGAKPLALGCTCWVCITLASLGMQHVLGIW